MSRDFVAVDVETANADRSSICQAGAVRVEGGVLGESWVSLIDPETWFDPWNIEIHGITPEMVAGQPRFPDVTASLRDFVGASVVACHTPFDRIAVERAHLRYETQPPCWCWLDTARVARRAWGEFCDDGYGLANVAKRCGIEFRHHDALEDAKAAARVLLCAMDETGLDVPGWLQRVRGPIFPDTGKAAVSREGDPEGPLFGEVVVFTGGLSLPRLEAATRAAALGCDVRNSVTTKTTILVVGQQDLARLGGYTKSTKQRRAEELIAKGAGIAVIGEEDFMRLGEVG